MTSSTTPLLDDEIFKPLELLSGEYVNSERLSLPYSTETKQLLRSLMDSFDGGAKIDTMPTQIAYHPIVAGIRDPYGESGVSITLR